ncbi:NAD(P)-dependent oxidoreductase [Rhodococcus erythropolis]|uniref:NAD(P)-dependent oxidoreductase n=1 Tax=Rhodococcus erythropolis TaxID=1833 RepID=UPI0024B6487E|nr:NAD(P)-dependent oxidoreductase [Rhodococcus erythropolis]
MSSSSGAELPVGLVGLGVMGLGIARRLVSAGAPLVGYDISADRVEKFAALGGTSMGSPQAVLEQAEIVITSLPSAQALRDVVGAPGGFLAAAVAGKRVIVETSTLDLETKDWARAALQGVGLELLDSPVSGTEVQLDAGDAVTYLSGAPDAVARASNCLAQAIGSVVDVGEFGHGTKIKLIANHLVAIHNLAAAEALVLAERSGLDPAVVLDALVAGAGSSRMLEVRGPLMMQGMYEPAQMSVRLFAKDLELISALADSADLRVGLFDSAREVYARALTAGLGDSDTASLYSLLRNESDPTH